MDQHGLPVYQHKEDILAAVAENQVLIVESPTGSGKTTQIPVILDEAGYTQQGVVGITQPRRIATLGVSRFIAQQLGDIVAYKMRFGDTTTAHTRIKILTDGILLQELRHDPLLSEYSIIMVDEAHERTLNIDFLLGLLKHTLAQRPDFKLIISSATINTQVFSRYFNDAPVVSIDATTYPVTVMYDPPAESDEEALLKKITAIVERVVLHEQRTGGILIFLSGERQIKQCLRMIETSKACKKIWGLPLYGMLIQEEQEKVFFSPPKGKVKVVVATNIAETSLTINGITTVIDSGLCKENAYNPHTYISTLMERPISRASANQRKGRAGRTEPGYCYRIYSKEDFDHRPAFALEEIYRTDLSEVVLRMAGLEIQDFTGFDFISRPSRSGIQGAIQTLKLLDALDKHNKLTAIGVMMSEFPLLPRHARILVKAIRNYPGAIRKCCIITSFLSTNSPFFLTEGQEDEAREAHHSFCGRYGDFTNYINLFEIYLSQNDKEKFCQQYHLDMQTMNEIVNIENQLEKIAGHLAGPLTDEASMKDVLICCGHGLVQFLCMHTGRGVYKGLTADRIFIHPGSVILDKNPPFIMAGEILKTSRMYARSVAPLDKALIQTIHPGIYAEFTSKEKTTKEARAVKKKNLVKKRKRL